MSFQFPNLQETIFDSAIAAVRSYRAERSEPLDGLFSIPTELAGISHIIPVEFARYQTSKLYTVIRASERGLSVVDTSLVCGIRAAGVDSALFLRLIEEPREDVYAPAIAHIRSEVGPVLDIVPLGGHFYRVEGTRGAELCYALFTENEEISGLAFGPTVGRTESHFAEMRIVGSAPLDSAFQVIWGGRRATENHHFGSREQRYAFDIEPPLSSTAHVLAIAEGVVSFVEDAHPDSGTAERGGRLSRLGNHIIVRTDAYEIVYAHLRRGSIGVNPGAFVHAGETLGEVGNSGHSTRRHLHIHARTLVDHQGIPIAFQICGKLREIERGEVITVDQICGGLTDNPSSLVGAAST